MGDSITRILTIAAVVGIGVLTGGVSLVAGAGLLTGLSGASLFAAYVTVGVAASYALEAFAPKPKSPGIGDRDYRATIRAPISPRRWIYGRARIGGVLAYVDDGLIRHPGFIPLPGATETLLMVYLLSEGEIDAIEKIWLAGEEMPFQVSNDIITPTVNQIGGRLGIHLRTRGVDRIRLYIHRGQASGSPLQRIWGRPNALQGISAVGVHLGQYKRGPWSSVPSFEFLVKGVRISWPGQPNPIWTENAAACRYHYMTVAKGVNPAYFDEPSVISAAAISGEEYAADQGSELRYSINGVISDDDDFDSVIKQMDLAWSGTAPEINGLIHFRPGAPRSARATIEATDLVDGEHPAWSLEPDLENRADALDSALRAEADHDFLPFSMPRYGSSAVDAVVEDLGDFYFVAYRATATRLLKFLLAHRQNQARTRLHCVGGRNLERFALEATDRILLHFPNDGMEHARYFIDRAEKHFNGTVTLDVVEEPEGLFDASFDQVPTRAGGAVLVNILERPSGVVARVEVSQENTANRNIFVTADQAIDSTDLQVRYRTIAVD